MLTEQQQSWLNKLSNTDHVSIAPYDPRVIEVFRQQAAGLRSLLGDDAVILHKGASAWGISGKGDIDIYIPIAAEQFESCLERLRPTLGEPNSHYPQARVRWTKQAEGIEIEIFIVNQEAEFYKDSLLFWDYVETHPEVLAAYERVKAEAEGASTRAYYTQKAIFISQIVQALKG